MSIFNSSGVHEHNPSAIYKRVVVSRHLSHLTSFIINENTFGMRYSCDRWIELIKIACKQTEHFKRQSTYMATLCKSDATASTSEILTYINASIDGTTLDILYTIITDDEHE